MAKARKPPNGRPEIPAPDALVSMNAARKRFGCEGHYLSGLIDGMGMTTFHGPRGSKCIAESDARSVETRLRQLGKLAPVGAR